MTEPRIMRFRLALAAALSAILAAPALADEGSGLDYARASTGTRLLEKGDIDIRMLLEASNLGGPEIEIGEITLPTSYGQGGDHFHGRMEITRVGDSVAHAVLSNEPVKALVIWLPAGEADRLVEEFGYSESPLD
jgi:hypothetical protein